MLPIYFPTDIVLDVKPVSAVVDRDAFRKLIIRTDYNEKMPVYHKEVKGTMLLSDEVDAPSLMIFGSHLLPMTKCTVTVGEDFSNPSVGFDPKEGEMISLPRGVVPAKYASCHAWTNNKTLPDIIANLFARVTNMQATEEIKAPTAIRNNFGYQEPRRRFGKGGDNEREATGFVFYEGVWYAYTGTKLLDIKTKEVKYTDVNPHEQLVVIETDSGRYYRDDHIFSFGSSMGNTDHWRNIPMTFNHTASVTDVDFGKKFYDNLGIKYDVYDKVEFDSQGFVDTKQFMEGEHDFAVLKRKCLVIDEEAIKALIEAAHKHVGRTDKTEEETKDDEDGFFNFGGRGTFSERKLKQALATAKGILATVEKVDDKVLANLVISWRVTTLADTILAAFEGDVATCLKMDAGSIKPGDFWFYKQLLPLITKEMKIYVPVLTPRFSNLTAAYLKAAHNTLGLDTTDLVMINETTQLKDEEDLAGRFGFYPDPY